MAKTGAKPPAAKGAAAALAPEAALPLAAASEIKAHKAKNSHRGAKPGRVLLGEFTVCVLVLGLGTIVAPQGPRDGVPRLISRGSGLCLLFFILSLLSTTGAGAKRAADGLGALVTVAYLVTSTDARNILTWISGFYSKTGVTPSSEDYVERRFLVDPLTGTEERAPETIGPLDPAAERGAGAAVAAGVQGATG